MHDCEREATVGVFMPAYNQGQFIEEALDSLKCQTFQDFIVHIVDDGSNDGVTVEKMKSIDYEKAKVFLNVDNRGVAFRARQHYKMLNTDYVLVLCADDILAPTFLEKTVVFLTNKDDYGAVSTNYRLFNDNVEKYYYEGRYSEEKMNLKNELARNQVLGSSLMRRKALMETDLSGEFSRYQDWDRWISMLEKGWKIGLVDEPLFYYRQVQSSLSHSASIDDELKIRKQLLKKHKSSYKKYYDDVIINMEYAFLEMKESKDWLDGQYNWLKKENEELRKKLESCGIGDEQQKRKRSGEKKQWVKMKRVFGRH